MVLNMPANHSCFQQLFDVSVLVSAYCPYTAEAESSSSYDFIARKWILWMVFSDSFKQKCRRHCPRSTYEDHSGAVCLSCPAPCEDCRSNTLCITCQPGYFLSGTRITSLCFLHFYNVNTLLLLFLSCFVLQFFGILSNTSKWVCEHLSLLNTNNCPRSLYLVCKWGMCQQVCRKSYANVWFTQIRKLACAVLHRHTRKSLNIVKNK